MKKNPMYYVLPFLMFALSGLSFILLAAEPPIEQGINNSSSPTAGESLSDTASDEGGISVLDENNQTMKFTPLDGGDAKYYSIKDAEVLKEGEKVQKSNLAVGQVVRIYYFDNGDVHVVKMIEILPPANK